MLFYPSFSRLFINFHPTLIGSRSFLLVPLGSVALFLSSTLLIKSPPFARNLSSVSSIKIHGLSRYLINPKSISQNPLLPPFPKKYQHFSVISPSPLSSFFLDLELFLWFAFFFKRRTSIKTERCLEFYFMFEKLFS